MKNEHIQSRAEFDGAVQGAGKKIVLFYSSWCPFCLSFMPAFDKTAGAAPNVFLKVCIDNTAELEEAFGIEVVPTVLFFESGKLVKRLDGALGRGLTEDKLAGFISACGVGAARD